MIQQPNPSILQKVLTLVNHIYSKMSKLIPTNLNDLFKLIEIVMLYTHTFMF
jgi:DNA-directed RNA polymerase specialized sigma subunit